MEQQKTRKAVNDEANEAVTHFLLPGRVDFRQTGKFAVIFMVMGGQ